MILSLITKFLKAGHKDPKSGKVIKSDIGIPQGGILSPILCNIIMHKFDEYMDKAIAKFEKGKRRRHNPEYQKLVHLRRKAKTLSERRIILKQMRLVPHGDPMDPGFKRMMYLRYADDFIILIIGTKDEAKLTKIRCKDALRRLCGAVLNDEKTLVTNMHEGSTFLGTEIRKQPKQSEFTGYGGRNAGIRTITRRLLLNAPINKIMKDLEKASMLRKNSKGKFYPKGCTALTNLRHYDIVKFYNQKIHGIKNFYSFASNYSSLGTIIWFLHLSCALTLSRKMKLITAAKTFAKFGRLLEDPETGIKLIRPDNMKVTHKFQTSNEIPDPEVYANIT